jgi:hypothetical protein
MKVEWLKVLARKLRRTLAQHGLTISHGQALDLIAAIAGLRNWSEAMAFPERVAACRFDDAAAERIARAVTARHGLPVSIDKLMVSLWFMSAFHQRSSASSTERLIVTTTDTGAGHLKQSRRADKVIHLRDRLVWGPVPAAATPTAFFEARDAAYAGDPMIRHEMFDWDRAEAASDDWFEVLALCEAYQRVELWIDPTPNEQLLFIQLLDRLAFHPEVVEKLFVVHAEDPLGGRGPNHPQTIEATARKVGQSELTTAVRAWSAYCERSPAGFCALLGLDLDALPYLRRAVLLLLAELPAAATALGATERLLLGFVAPGGIAPNRLFGLTAQYPDRVFMSWEDGRMVDRLAACPAPAILGLLDGPFDLALHADRTRHARYHQSRLSLSSLGRALLEGKDDFSAYNPIHRWWGGTLLTNENLWRWDAVNQKLIPPP